MKPKVIVIGLDCGTFKFIKPFAKLGYLPNFSKIMANGVSRILKSTTPPVSPPAWTTFLTGKNPGKHGIFQFVNMDIRDYSFTSNRLINSTIFSGNTFIDLIGDNGLKVGVVKVPFTYPPWEVNGFMIAGEPSPDWTKAHTYPSSLSNELGRMNLGSSSDFMLYDVDKLLEHLKFDCEVRTRITCEMLDKQESDFFMVVYTATDAAVHRLWKYTDPQCPTYVEKFRKYQNVIRDVYVMVDQCINQVLQKIDNKTTVFFMSDHGATRNPLFYFHINAWLRNLGYLSCNEKSAYHQTVRTKLIKIKNIMPSRLRHLFMSAIKEKYLKSLSDIETTFSSFRWPETRAYGVSIFPTIDGIVLNLKGRQPEGIVEPGNDAECILDEIQEKLSNIRDPQSGEFIVEEIVRRENVYHGEYAEKMPDLIIKYKPEFSGGRGTGEKYLSNVPDANFEFQSGSHDENGIFMAYGPFIKKGAEMDFCHIQDMAPTILYGLGLPIPSDMDGQVILDIFKETFTSKNPIKINEKVKHTNTNYYELNDVEQNEMKKQLKGLGYL